MKKIIIANWKMNLSPKEEEDLATQFVEKLSGESNVEVVICPAFVSLTRVAEVLKNKKIKLGAQDGFWREKGAYTGEISPLALKEIGCEFVILGHSERRAHLGETDETVNLKVRAVLENNLTPIICVGETMDERREKHTDYVVLRQLERALKNIHLTGSEELVIAYEPVWAIGTGQPVEAEEAEAVFAAIRQSLIDLYPATLVNNNIRLIYGGSVDGANAGDFAKLDLGSGFLVGGASLDAEEFRKIIDSF
ncbi:MAG: triose-phosphate isomerase [Patescibacteria group bacterium]